MSQTNDTHEPTDRHQRDDRTALLLTGNSVVLYDTENPSSWIESDRPVALAARR